MPRAYSGEFFLILGKKGPPSAPSEGRCEEMNDPAAKEWGLKSHHLSIVPKEDPNIRFDGSATMTYKLLSCTRG